MEEKFTVEEFKNYLLQQDSRGDIMYNLSAENIRKANISDADGCGENKSSKCGYFYDLGYCGNKNVESNLCIGADKCGHFTE